MKSSNPDVRATAARKLGESSEKKAVPALIEGLSDEDSSVRIAAANALGCLVHPASVDPLAAALERLSKSGKARPAGSDKGQEAAEYEALATALGKQGAPAVTPLVRQLGWEDRRARRWAAFALGIVGAPSAVAPLAERLGDNRSEVRKAAAQALGAIGDSSALNPLKRGMASRDPETRSAIAEALGAVGGEGAADALIAAIEDENEVVQLAAIESLRRIGGLRSGRGLRRVFESAKKKAVSETAAAALKSISYSPANAEERALAAVLAGDFPAAVTEGKAATEALVEALGSRDALRRRQAAEALGVIRPEQAVQSLLKVLKDYDCSVRETAADALAKIGSPALDGLISSLDSPDSIVERLVARILGQIGDARSVAALADAISRNRTATSAYPEPLEVVRAAADALTSIFNASIFKVNQNDLERAASVPDAWLEHPEGESLEGRRPERAVDCTPVRELARQELTRRELKSPD